jgi:hypothetical protein
MVIGWAIKAEQPMDRSVARLNIEHYRKLLTIETDESRRQTLLRLLSEEEAKLSAPAPPERKRHLPN